MAGDFAAVFTLLQPHMARLDAYIRSQLDGFEPEIRAMADYCIDTSGKRIRPALVFLSGARAGTVPSDDLIRVAAVVELVHLATLVHDDIMDEADLRRNRRTASREYGAEAAVLLGDALFSHALNLATQFPTTEVCAAVSESTRKVCAGEIIQTLRRGSTNISHADYRRGDRSENRRAFPGLVLSGSRLAGYPQDFVDAATRFGRHLGIAYQIYDDLADFFGDEKRIGKTLGTDLASGKITLPLLDLMEQLPEDDRAQLVEEILKRRPPQLALRIAQMNRFGVFARVAEAIHAELRLGEDALAPHAGLEPVALLLRLGQVLRAQVTALSGAVVA
ncbi:MAG: polyprenyl synthetase family protein [Nibricoccus sp.]